MNPSKNLSKQIHSSPQNRRKFLKSTASITSGLFGMAGFSFGSVVRENPINEGLYVIGPMEGYTPHIGILVSMLNYNRHTIIEMVKGLSVQQMDYLHDPQANTIGALLLHLGATEVFYQANTFEGRQDYNEEEKKIWGAAMNLGEEGREKIKGQDTVNYIQKITEIRQKTLNQLKKKDDEWLMAIDPVWSEKESYNTYWKWFHVCEHEANHRGQIAWLKSRLPASENG